MKNNHIYAVRLCEIREDRGLSKGAVSAALGVAPGTYYKYEICTICPSVKMLVQIADFFSVSVDYLIGHETRGSLDTTEQQVCKYTGLSPLAVGRLHNSPVRDIQIQWR
ncbi:MAG: helix-turn-helix domain-containing protein [Acutalibacteraceae bacterium]